MSTTATTSASGGLDVPVLVSQLMTVANQPIVTLQNQVSNDQAEISAWGIVSGLVSSFQTAAQSLNSSVQSNSATPSDASVFSASATSTAVPGNYSLSVSQLAQAQTLVAAGQTSTSAAIGTVGDTLTINVGSVNGATFTSSSSTSITLNSGNNSLQGISDAINAANMGVTATIVNDGSSTPYRLVLTSNNSGASNSLQVTTTGSSALNTLLAYDPTTGGTENMTQTVAAQDANLTVNGIAITSASNTIANAVQGVTLTLNSKTTTPVTLTVAHDTAAISTAVTNFVSAYNALSVQLASYFTYGNPVTGLAGGALAGDGTVSVMQQQLQSIFDTPATGGTLQYLAQIGVGFQSNGTLAVDSATLNNALTNNFSDVTNLLSSSTGFATTLGAWATSALSPGNGMLATATQSLKSTISNLNTSISRLQVQNAQLQATYTTEYSDLNMLLSSLNSTSSYLTSQLANLSK